MRRLRNGSSIRRFVGDRRANFAVIAALTVVPCALAIGGASDLAMMYRSQQTVQSALDAATLAAAQAYSGDSNEQNLRSLAQNYFDANASSLFRTTATMTYSGVTTTGSGDRQMRLTACSTFKPIFLNLASMKLAGIEGSTCLQSESIVLVSSTKVEVAMVLDTSGSMNSAPAAGGPPKITTLKNVATQAVGAFFGAGPSTGGEDPVRMSIVPFSGGVNIGASHLNDWWMDTKGVSPIHHENFDWSTLKNALTGVVDAKPSVLYPGAWTLISDPTTFLTRQYLYKKLGAAKSNWAYKGCVESRPAPYGITDAPPDLTNAATLFVPYFAPDESDELNTSWTNSYLNDVGGSGGAGRMRTMNKYMSPTQDMAMGTNYHFSPSWLCDSNPLLPLTTVKADVLAAIDSLVATGATNVAQGVEWGWKTLSKNEPFTTGRAAGLEDNIKAMIVMTDGEHTYYNDTYNSLASNPNISAFGGYGFTATDRIFDYKTGVSTAKTTTNYTLAMDGRMAAICENAKSDGKIALKAANGAQLSDEQGPVKRDGIIIYTIAFDIPASSKARVDALLKGCASYRLPDLRDTTKSYAKKEKYFYSASSAEDLNAAFKDIAASLSKLRIAK